MKTEQNIIHINKKNELTEEEIIKAKENCFIILGKTGTGKTSLLNLIYGGNIAKVGYESKSETKISSYYCIKEEINSKKICFSIIDTPGLYDSDVLQNDEKIKNNTKELIAKENLKIKGILFLSNFQNERFDYSEIDSLFQYNAFFPLKNFWDHIILIFTHYYGDPDGDTKEEMRDQSIDNLSFLFSKLMDRIKEVSTPKKFIELERIYVNIHSRIKNEKHIKDNEVYRKQILAKIYQYSELEPMYNKYCVFNFNNIESENYNKFLFNSQLELFLDEKNNIINKIFKMISIVPKNNDDDIKDKNQIEMNMINCEINNKGNLSFNNITKKGSINDFKLYICGGGLTILSFFGIEHFIIPYPPISCIFISALLLGCHFICKNYNNIKNSEEIVEKKKEQMINELNIKYLIEDEIIKYMENNLCKK